MLSTYTIFVQSYNNMHKMITICCPKQRSRRMQNMTMINTVSMFTMLQSNVKPLTCDFKMSATSQIIFKKTDVRGKGPIQYCFDCPKAFFVPKVILNSWLFLSDVVFSPLEEHYKQTSQSWRNPRHPQHSIGLKKHYHKSLRV